MTRFKFYWEYTLCYICLNIHLLFKQQYSLEKQIISPNHTFSLMIYGPSFNKITL